MRPVTLVAIVCAMVWGIPSARLTFFALRRPSGNGAHASFAEAWQVERYRAGEGSDLGALGVRSCSPVSPWFAGRARLLRLDVDFSHGDPDRRQGECWFDVDTLGLGRVLNLAGGSVEASLLVPFSLTSKYEEARIAGAQLIAESESADGHRGRLYSSWADFTNWWALETRALTITGEPVVGSAWKDADFNPLRIVRLGVKLALNSAAQGSFRRSVILTDFVVHLPSAAAIEEETRRLRTRRQPPPDVETLARLDPLESRQPDSVRLFGDRVLTPMTSSVRSLELVPEPANIARRVWKVELQFPKYEPDSTGRTARFSYVLSQPLDLRRTRLTAWAAVGPSLRGFTPRPNRIEFELVDESGHLFRGPAADVSANGMSFDMNAREFASRWIRFDVSPGAGRQQTGSRDDAFDAGRVRQVGIRFVVGKFSNELRLEPYPLTGTLLLSNVMLEDDPHAVDLVAALDARHPVEKQPVPFDQFQIGVNYGTGHRYGYNAGLYPFGGRNLCGFSDHRQKLLRDFRSLAENDIHLVRIFLMDDLRSGVVLDQTGRASGLDPCARRDVRALIETAADAGIQLIVVLMDYLIADGARPAKEFGVRRWSEGEHPQLIIDAAARQQFLARVVQPIVQEIADANRDYGGRVIFAVDVANEFENATAVFRRETIRDVKTFVRDVLGLIRSTGLKTTFGSRSRRDLIRYWSDLDGIDIWQFHYYDAMQEDGESWHLPAGQLGLVGPVIMGELEPSNIEEKIQTAWADGYSAVLFWAAQSVQDTQPLDGFRIDFSAIKRWREAKRPPP
jgi:hypothetical protein